MAVTSLLTTLEDWASASAVDYGGGQGSSSEANILIEGAAAWSRRADNATDFGFAASLTNIDLSAAGEHVVMWTFVTQWPSVTQVQVRLSSGPDDDHDWPTANIPDTQGWVPIWVDVSRPPEVGGSADEASIDEIGVLLDIGDVGGNAKNLVLDKISNGTSGLRWTGTGPGDMADFRTEESTNVWGALVPRDGVDYCFARLEVGNPSSSTESDFDDSNVLLVWPDQPLVSSTFMGISFDIQHASTVQALTNSVLASGDPAGATNRPDLLVTGTGGTLDLSGDTIQGMRIVTFTSGVTMTGGSIGNSGQITPAGSTVSAVTITNPTDDGAVLVTAETDLDNWSDITFEGAGIGGTTADAAIEIDISGTGPHSIDLDNFTFANRVGSSVDLYFVDQGADRTYNINILGGGDTPTFTKARAGDTVNIINSKNYTLTGMNDGTELTVLDRSIVQESFQFSAVSATNNIGSSSASEKAGQSFQVTTAGKTGRISVVLQKVGNPTDSLRMRLVNGVPGSTLLLESDLISGEDLTTGWVTYVFQLHGKTQLNTATTYGFEIERTGAVDGSNYYQYRGENAYASGSAYNYNAGWSTILNDFFFEVFEDASENELFHVESSVGNEIYTHGGVVKEVEVLAMHTDYKPIAIIDALATTDSSLTLSQSPDNVYSNP